MDNIRLVVNADDFGLDSSINRAIIKGHREGIITSTSLLASGHAFDEAVALAKENPTLGIGIHTCLVGGLEPVSAPKDVSTLLVDGRFPMTYGEFAKRLASGEVNMSEIYTELDRQFAKILDTGLPITHVDGHQHLHVLPQLTPMVLSLMKKYNLDKVRIPGEERLFTNGLRDWKRFVGKSVLTETAERARSVMVANGIGCTNYFWGMMSGGQLTEERLADIIRRVATKVGSHEIMTHPGDDTAMLDRKFGWHYHWEDELAAMCAPLIKNAITAAGISLVTYKDIYGDAQ